MSVFIPKAVCGECQREMTIKITGLMVEMLSGGEPYYKISSDVFECPGCAKTVIILAEKQVAEHYQAHYGQYRAAFTAHLQ